MKKQQNHNNLQHGLFTICIEINTDISITRKEFKEPKLLGIFIIQHLFVFIIFNLILMHHSNLENSEMLALSFISKDAVSESQNITFVFFRWRIFLLNYFMLNIEKYKKLASRDNLISSVDGFCPMLAACW